MDEPLCGRRLWRRKRYLLSCGDIPTDGVRLMTTSWLVNGADEAVDPGDRGLAYGDGLFETMAVLDGEVRRLDLHLDRLMEGCRRLKIAPPDPGAIRDDLEALRSDEDRAVAKLIVTRGPGARGYLPTGDSQSTRIVGIGPWPDYPAANHTDGVAVRNCELRLGENPILAGLKHLNRLEHVLARMEWEMGPWDEGLLTDTSGSVVSGTMSNVFTVRGDTLLTPSLRRCGVKGVMRRTVIESAPAQGLEVEESDFAPGLLNESDEVFLTNAVFGIWPVRQLDQQQFEPGAVTRKLMRVLGAGAHA